MKNFKAAAEFLIKDAKCIKVGTGYIVKTPTDPEIGSGRCGFAAWKDAFQNRRQELRTDSTLQASGIKDRLAQAEARL